MFHTGNVSNLEYAAFFPWRYSWYICERHVANLPEPGPGAVTTTMGRSVGTYSFFPYPASETIVSTSAG